MSLFWLRVGSNSRPWSGCVKPGHLGAWPFPDFDSGGRLALELLRRSDAGDPTLSNCGEQEAARGGAGFRIEPGDSFQDVPVFGAAWLRADQGAGLAGHCTRNAGRRRGIARAFPTLVCVTFIHNSGGLVGRRGWKNVKIPDLRLHALPDEITACHSSRPPLNE
jgi:hypothetical protein